MESSLPLYIGITVLLFLIAAVFFFIAMYARLLEELNTLRTSHSHTSLKEHQDATRLVEQAKNRSLEIIEASERKAKEIIASTDFFSAVSSDQISESVKTASQKQTQDYLKVLEQVKVEVLSQHVEKEAVKDMEDFRKNLEAETLKSENMLETKVQEEHKKSNAELTAYKQTVIKKIDENMFEIVNQVVHKVVGKTLTPAEHQALVLQALEEAKQNHVF